MIIKQNQVPIDRAERESFGVADTLPCSYLIVGTRVERDVCHYPDSGRTLHRVGKDWQLLEADGQVFKSGSF